MMRPFIHESFVLAVLALPCAAQMTWTRQQPASSPTARAFHMMACDNARQRVVLFGGVDVPTTALNDTWEWDGFDWTRRNPATSPPARRHGGIAFDAGRGMVVVFGGEPSLNGPFLNDTWEWDGTSWVARVTPLAPSARRMTAMAYDAVRQRVVLFGGECAAAGRLCVASDTWEWDGTGWILRTPSTTPVGRFSHGMAFDRARGQVVMFGGRTDHTRGNLLGDTWEWDGTDWRLRSTSGPAPRGQHGTAYDAHRQRTIVFGGSDDVGGLSDTWEWDGNRWLRQSPSQRPPSGAWLMTSGMAYDETRGEVLLFGGFDGRNTLFADTWSYAPTQRGTTTPLGAGCAGSTGLPAIGPLGPPIVANAGFGLVVSNVLPRVPVFLALSGSSAPQAIAGCVVHPSLPSAVTLVGTSSVAGEVTFSAAIPPTASLSGLDAFAQAGILDSGGALFGSLALTPGLRIHIGD